MVAAEGVARAGEFLAASILESHGSRASHVAIYGTDLWVETPTKRMLRVQVKTASSPVLNDPKRGPFYRYMNSKTRSDHSPPDLYLLVALDLQLMLVRDRMGLGGSKILAKHFTPEAQEAGIAKHLY